MSEDPFKPFFDACGGVNFKVKMDIIGEDEMCKWIMEFRSGKMAREKLVSMRAMDRFLLKLVNGAGTPCVCCRGPLPSSFDEAPPHRVVCLLPKEEKYSDQRMCAAVCKKCASFGEEVYAMRVAEFVDALATDVYKDVKPEIRHEDLRR